jgi:CarboxypepD_reg-like domain
MTPIKFFLFLLLHLLCSGLAAPLFAQRTGSLTGSVKDKLTQESLIGVTIRIEGAELGTATDANGDYHRQCQPG